MKKFSSAALVFTTVLTLLALSAAAASAADSVVPVPIGKMILKPASLFDLHGKLLRYVPAGASDYKVSLETDRLHGAPGIELKPEDRSGQWFAKGWKYTLPFEFPFAGRKWRELHVNRRGNLSFERSESELMGDSDRNLWATGGMTSLASAMDLRARAGKERMISALWADYNDARVKVEAGKGSVLFTWIATRNYGIEAQDATPSDRPPTETISTFRARLFSDGRIELSYPEVRVKEGIVGVFAGAKKPAARLLTEIKGKLYNGTPGISTLKSLKIYDEGSLLRFTFEMQDAVPKTVSTGTLAFRAHLKRNGFGRCLIDVTIGATGPMLGGNCQESPRAESFEIEGKLAHVRVSKLALGEARELSIGADTVHWGGPPGAFSQLNLDLSVPVPAGTRPSALTDLSTASLSPRSYGGDAFEAFHETLIPRLPMDYLTEIYKQRKDQEEFALVATDFAIDDLYGMIGGAIPFNVAIQGIGPRQASVTSTEKEGNAKLFAVPQVFSMAHPLSAERGKVLPDFSFKAHFPLMRLLDHELNHRWGMHMAFIHPETKKRVELTSSDGHWIEALHSPSVARVWQTYSDTEYSEQSNMGGMFWVDNGDGTFTRKPKPYHAPAGYTSLDLYVLGLIPPEEVPDTFLLEDIQSLSWDKVKAKKTPVRIADIVAAQGARVPAAKDAPRKFKLRLYLLHHGEAPRPAMLARAKSAAAALRKHYSLASGGRIEMTE